jgi:hypothetical protein
MRIFGLIVLVIVDVPNHLILPQRRGTASPNKLWQIWEEAAIIPLVSLILEQMENGVPRHQL